MFVLNLISIISRVARTFAVPHAARTAFSGGGNGHTKSHKHVENKQEAGRRVPAAIRPLRG